MTVDELKTMEKGSFILLKIETHPFISKLKLFTKWGIEFDSNPYIVADKDPRKVAYTSKEIIDMLSCRPPVESSSKSVTGGAVMSEQNKPPKPNLKTV